MQKNKLVNLEDRIMEITQSEHQTKKQMKKHESNIRHLCENTKKANLYTTGIPEGEGKKGGTEIISSNIFEKPSKRNKK